MRAMIYHSEEETPIYRLYHDAYRVYTRAKFIFDEWDEDHDYSAMNADPEEQIYCTISPAKMADILAKGGAFYLVNMEMGEKIYDTVIELFNHIRWVLSDPNGYGDVPDIADREELVNLVEQVYPVVARQKRKLESTGDPLDEYIRLMGLGLEFNMYHGTTDKNSAIGSTSDPNDRSHLIMPSTDRQNIQDVQTILSNVTKW